MGNLLKLLINNVMAPSLQLIITLAYHVNGVVGKILTLYERRVMEIFTSLQVLREILSKDSFRNVWGDQRGYLTDLSKPICSRIMIYNVYQKRYNSLSSIVVPIKTFTQIHV